MGKKSKNDKNKNKNSQDLPFVSICTPTFNRRPFIPFMIKCFQHQDYPMDKMEWIIVDDGTDKIEDLVGEIPQVKYFKFDEKMPLGKKRNVMHEKTKGEIIVYMDDDDYYPPERVSHAVKTLLKKPQALCCGSSEIYIYFKHIDKLVQFGPYNPNHATAGTFAFRRKLLEQHQYNDTAALAEEKEFLKNYTVPFAQLDPLKTILVFSHEHNTFDKKKLLGGLGSEYIKESAKTVKMFVKKKEFRDFYINELELLLKDYEPGRPIMKPDVLKQTSEIEKQREIDMENNIKNSLTPISVVNDDGSQRKLTILEVTNTLSAQAGEINKLGDRLKEKEDENNTLKKIILDLNKNLFNLKTMYETLKSEKNSLTDNRVEEEKLSDTDE